MRSVMSLDMNAANMDMSFFKQATAKSSKATHVADEEKKWEDWPQVRQVVDHVYFRTQERWPSMQYTDHTYCNRTGNAHTLRCSYRAGPFPEHRNKNPQKNIHTPNAVWRSPDVRELEELPDSKESSQYSMVQQLYPCRSHD